jgi:hypothetical protein
MPKVIIKNKTTMKAMWVPTEKCAMGKDFRQVVF